MMLGISNPIDLDMSLADFLDFAVQLKVELVEIKMDEPLLLSALVRAGRRKAITDITKSFSLGYSLHAPYIGVNLASVSKTLRRASERMILRSVEFAGDIGAKIVVSHVGRLSRDYRKEVLAQSVKSAVQGLRRLHKASNDYGLAFTIENDHRSSDYVLAGHPAQLLLLAQRVGCKITLDIGHANTLARIEALIDTLAEHVVNVHLHDNDGEHDAHLSMGRGNIDFPAVLEHLWKTGYKGPLVVEVHSSSGLRDSVTKLRHIVGRNTLG